MSSINEYLFCRTDFDKHILGATSLSPELRLQGDYHMKGRILLLPIFGEGKFNVTLSKLLPNINTIKYYISI